LPKLLIVQQVGKLMLRSHLILLLIAIAGFAGCAETQSQRAFTPRPAAEEVPVASTPSQVGAHDHALAEALDHSLQALEDEPMVPTRAGTMDKESATTQDVRPAASLASKSAGASP
jgi:hypothetical protein